MALFLGTTTVAHTATICAFLLGLALGYLVLGPRADDDQGRRRNLGSRPLRLYAEAAIGLFAAATPWLFPYVQALYAAVAGSLALAGAPAHALRFSMALVMLLPAFLMGGTPPALVCAVKGRSPFASTVGKAYGINTLGADDAPRIAFRQLPDPGSDQWELAVLDLGNRFRCLPD